MFACFQRQISHIFISLLKLFLITTLEWWKHLVKNGCLKRWQDNYLMTLRWKPSITCPRLGSTFYSHLGSPTWFCLTLIPQRWKMKVKQLPWRLFIYILHLQWYKPSSAVFFFPASFSAHTFLSAFTHTCQIESSAGGCSLVKKARVQQAIITFKPIFRQQAVIFCAVIGILVEIESKCASCVVCGLVSHLCVSLASWCYNNAAHVEHSAFQYLNGIEDDGNR